MVVTIRICAAQGHCVHDLIQSSCGPVRRTRWGGYEASGFRASLGGFVMLSYPAFEIYATTPTTLQGPGALMDTCVVLVVSVTSQLNCRFLCVFQVFPLMPFLCPRTQPRLWWSWPHPHPRLWQGTWPPLISYPDAVEEHCLGILWSFPI